MPGVFEVYVRTHFSAAHYLRGYPGDCAHMHGHNWIVEACVQCKELNPIGIGVDFRDLKEAVEEVSATLDHCNLNELPDFQKENPTSENIAKFLYGRLSQKLDTDVVRVSKVKVCETAGAGAFYWEE